MLLMAEVNLQARDEIVTIKNALRDMRVPRLGCTYDQLTDREIAQWDEKDQEIFLRKYEKHLGKKNHRNKVPHCHVLAISRGCSARVLGCPTGAPQEDHAGPARSDAPTRRGRLEQEEPARQQSEG